MDPGKLFFDDRLRGLCAYCGTSGNPRDHAPSKVFLDEPYPNNLPIVAACASCNEGVSLDEQYSACLIECALCGTTDPLKLGRSKIARILTENPQLASRIQSARQEDLFGGVSWIVESDRLNQVLVKLARGHTAFASSEPMLEEPSSVSVIPIHTMSQSSRIDFESVAAPVLLPEVGSRALISTIEGASSVIPN